jgi:hypothetical protein
MSGTEMDGGLEDVAELGAVDERGMRVWVRRVGAGEAVARLEVEGHAPVTASIPLSADTDWTGAAVLALPTPAPGCRFVCVVGRHRLTGRLAPTPETHAGLTFAFGSCNMPFRVRPDGTLALNRAAGIYPAMASDLRRVGAAFLLLAGDQIYSDALPSLNVRALGAGGRLPSPDETLAAYRRVYHRFFGEPGFRALRAALPTYCMWDDHDIFDNWGSLLRETPLDRRLFMAAARAFGDYQQRRNPDGAAGPPYPYTFRYGDIGFLVLDLRGARDYDAGRLLGTAQQRMVHDYLAGDDARTLRTLFVVASVPVAHVARWFVALFDRLPGPMGATVRDRWCSRAFVDGRDDLLEALFDWQTAAPARQVALLSGDVHAAGAFTIYRRGGRGVIQQFTSSPLTTQPGLLERTLNAVVVHGGDLLEPRLRFRRRLLVQANNFGLVRVEPLAEGGHRITFTVRAWRPRTRTLRTAGEVVARPS